MESYIINTFFTLTYLILVSLEIHIFQFEYLIYEHIFIKDTLTIGLNSTIDLRFLLNKISVAKICILTTSRKEDGHNSKDRKSYLFVPVSYYGG